jgi:hypothetical protein
MVIKRKCEYRVRSEVVRADSNEKRVSVSFVSSHSPNDAVSLVMVFEGDVG